MTQISSTLAVNEHSWNIQKGWKNQKALLDHCQSKLRTPAGCFPFMSLTWSFAQSVLSRWVTSQWQQHPSYVKAGLVQLHKTSEGFTISKKGHESIDRWSPCNWLWTGSVHVHATNKQCLGVFGTCPSLPRKGALRTDIQMVSVQLFWGEAKWKCCVHLCLCKPNLGRNTSWSDTKAPNQLKVKIPWLYS